MAFPSDPKLQLAERMRAEWDRRVAHDYRYWMSDGVESDASMWEVGARDFEILVRGLDPAALSSQTALEIGCGVGRLLRPASRFFRRVIGVDVSAEAVGKARELLSDLKNVELIAGSGIDLRPVPDAAVDFAFTFAAMSSMPVAVIAGYLIELARVVKTGGILRLQVYLGREQETCAEDTLAIRSFSKTRFVEALRHAGFDTELVAELQLPFEISNADQGVIAYIVTARRCNTAVKPADDVQQVLVEQSEKRAGATWQGSETEYLMAIARAKQHLEAGEAAQAAKALEFAIKHYGAADADVRELLAEMQERHIAAPPGNSAPAVPGPAQSQFGSSAVFEQNMRVVRDRFPQLAAQLEREPITDAVSLSYSPSGTPVISYQGLPLSHREKPERSGESWAERALHAPGIQAKSALIIVGFGDSHYLRALQQKWGKDIHVIEPDIEVLKAALSAVDCRALLGSISSLSLRLDDFRVRLAALNPENAELIIHTQTQVLQPDFAADVRRVFRSEQGFGQLRPSFAVVGPMWGGSLPIAEYTGRALSRMNQRVRYYGLDKFYESFVGLGDYLKSADRRGVVETRYIETISQIVLEGVSERPVDIVICLAQAPLSPRALTELRERGIITVMWFVEDCRRFLTWQQTARYYDYMFLIQKDEMPRLVEQAGAGRAVYLPVGCDPTIHRPLALQEEEKEKFGSSLSFVGAGYNNRRYLFSLLAQHDFKIWGTQWPACLPFTKLVQDSGRRIAVEEYVKIFNASAINLNLHSSSERDGVEPNGDFVNPRTFELAACGAFQLVDNRRYLPENFVPGKEVATFSGEREMIDLCDYYLAHPEERKLMAEAAFRRALSEHTYEHRLKTMLEYIYADRFEELRARVEQSPWARTFEAAKPYEELSRRLQLSYNRGEEPVLEALVDDIQTGKGALTETEQRLLFMHHIKSQISYVRKLRKEE